MRVFNKIDALENAELTEIYLNAFREAWHLRAHGPGMSELVLALQDELSSWRLRSRYSIPLTEPGHCGIHRIGPCSSCIRGENGSSWPTSLHNSNQSLLALQRSTSSACDRIERKLATGQPVHWGLEAALSATY